MRPDNETNTTARGQPGRRTSPKIHNRDLKSHGGVIEEAESPATRTRGEVGDSVDPFRGEQVLVFSVQGMGLRRHARNGISFHSIQR